MMILKKISKCIHASSVDDGKKKIKKKKNKNLTLLSPCLCLHQQILSWMRLTSCIYGPLEHFFHLRNLNKFLSSMLIIFFLSSNLLTWLFNLFVWDLKIIKRKYSKFYEISKNIFLIWILLGRKISMLTKDIRRHEKCVFIFVYINKAASKNI